MARERRGFRHRESRRTRANRSPAEPWRASGREGSERAATAGPDVSAGNGGGAASFMIDPYRALGPTRQRGLACASLARRAKVPLPFPSVDLGVVGLLSLLDRELQGGFALILILLVDGRSEERRVGKEWRLVWWRW